MTEVGGWVWPANVEPLLRWLSHYVGYVFDDSDWQAVADALPATDDEAPEGWYAYPLEGQPKLLVHLARSIGSAPVMVRVVGGLDSVLVARVETLLDLLADVGNRE